VLASDAGKFLAYVTTGHLELGHRHRQAQGGIAGKSADLEPVAGTQHLAQQFQ
jgi:hypothetical protein